MNDYVYAGDELDLFGQASNWKSYLAAQIVPYIGEKVIEVGAGIGATTRMLNLHRHANWLCIEPDATLEKRLRENLTRHPPPTSCDYHLGVLETVDPDRNADTLLYIDVLEHIRDDEREIRIAERYLARHGNIIVLSPAHQWLMSQFDDAIGHYRRYSKSRLHAVMTGSTLRCQRLCYLDSLGMLASLANALLLKRRMPTRRQIGTWDRLMVPMSRVLDPLLCHALGKSLLGIYQRIE